MQSKKKGNFLTAIVAIAVSLLLVAGIIALFNIDWNEVSSASYSWFYLVKGDEKITSNIGDMRLEAGETVTIDIKYIGLDGNEQNNGYSAKIVPVKSNQTQVSYKKTTDQGIVSCNFANIEDLSSVFNLQLKEGQLTFEIPEKFSVEDVILAYEGDGVTFDQTFIDYEYCHYKLIVTSFDEQTSYTIYFDKCVPVESLNFYGGQVDYYLDSWG